MTRSFNPYTPLIDLAALVVFAVLARLAHGGLSLHALVETYWPWALGALAGWVIVLGTKAHGRWREGAIVWASTVVGGMIIWALVHGRLPHWSFLIVATVMSALMLFGWRAIAGALARRR